MATTKNITMKQFNGTDYDTLYPKTIGAQIVGAVPIAAGGTNGTTAPSGVNNLVAGLSQIAPASKDLFPFRDISGNTGGSVTLANLAVALGNNGVITPSNLAAQASALGFAKIQTGSYVGTGTYGANNPCSLTFDFVPKVLTLFGEMRTATNSHGLGFITMLCNSGQYNADNMGLIRTVGKINVDGTTVSWYEAYTQTSYEEYRQYGQMNGSGQTYYYAAIG